MTHQSFTDIGQNLTEWGLDCGKSLNDTITHLFSNKDYRLQISLAAAILKELRSLSRGIRDIPSQVNRDQHKQAIALEREKQKTAKAMAKAADAQAKAAAESAPVNVTVIQMKPEEIERAIGNGRVRHRF
jgi:hypothetical protein